MHKALPNVSRRAKNRSLASFNRCLALKDRLLKFYPQEGTTSAGMAELLGLAGRHGEEEVARHRDFNIILTGESGK